MASDAKASELPRIPASSHPPPFNLMEWAEANRKDLKPPVANKMIHNKGCQFKIMIVGGPNTRTDYHINEGEEWFYMLKGDMVLKVVDGGEFRDVPIAEGECFNLPARVPHSPQRFKDTIGLVIERERNEPELDGLRWYCRQKACMAHNAVIYETFFKCEDLGSQLAALIRMYYSTDSKALRTCKRCGVVDEPATGADTSGHGDHAPDKEGEDTDAQRPVKKSKTDGKTSETKADPEAEADADTATAAAFKAGLPRLNTVTHHAPMSLWGWVEANKHDFKPPVGNKMICGKGCQWKVMVVGGPNTRTDYHIDAGEEWFWMLKGDMVLKVVDGGEFKDVVIKQGQCFLLPGYVPHSPQRKADTIGLVIERERWGNELDGLRWYCSKCRKVVFEEFFVCEDLGTQIAAKVTTYYASEAMRTCKHCGTIDTRP